MPMQLLSRRTVLIIVGLLAGALAAVGIDYAEAHANTTVLQTGNTTTAGPGDPSCQPNAPDYTGCTNDQIRNLEAGSVDDVERHYHGTGVGYPYWGQSGHEWDALNANMNDKLAKLYAGAVADYKKGHGGNAPKYTTWGGFKAETNCLGIFRVYRYNYCGVAEPLNDWAAGINNVTIDCTGVALAFGGATYAVARQQGEAITAAPSAVTAGAVGALGCVGKAMYDQIWGWVSSVNKAQRLDPRTAAIG